jgi:hypothetical protein
MADKTNQEKLDDLWWILCAPDGRPALMNLIAEAVTSRVFNTPIPRQGKGTGIGPETSLGAMVAWHDSGTLDVIAAAGAGAAADGATVDEIKEAMKDVMANGTVKVDVSVKGAE